MKVTRIISRTSFYLQRSALILLSYFNHRIYMKFYPPPLTQAWYDN